MTILAGSRGLLGSSRLQLVVAATVLFSGSPLLSAQESVSKIDCSQGGRTQMEMSVCVQRATQAAVAKLDALLSELRAVLSDSQVSELNAIQELWVRTRDRECTWESSFFAGGSVAPFVHGNCVLKRTEQRIQNLRLFLCEGQGMTGECPESEKYK